MASFKFFVKALDKFFSVNDALGLDLVNISLEHGLKSGPKRLFWELKLGQNLFHLGYCHAPSTLCVSFLQRIVELQLFEEHFSDVDFVQEQFVVNLACFVFVELLNNYVKFALQHRQAPFAEALLEICVRNKPCRLHIFVPEWLFKDL